MMTERDGLLDNVNIGSDDLTGDGCNKLIKLMDDGYQWEAKM
jgi:hypothetical protein